MEIKTFFTLFLYQSLQIGRADAEGVGFSCGVDFCQYHVVCQGQGFGEVLEQGFGTGVGVWLEDTYIRRYPYDSLACNVIGYTVSGNVGQYGIEQQYSDTLNGEDGRTYNYLNEDLEQEKNVRAAVDGDSVMSTIDVTLQEIVEKAINDFQEKLSLIHI